MRILIADDDPVPLRLLEVLLARWGYEVVVATNGMEAWQLLQQEDAPRLAILDWLMPGMDGVEICRQVRRQHRRFYLYLLLLTAKDEKKDVIEGLEAGADDYLTKPFNPHELQVRLRVGQRTLELEESLLSLQAALRDQPAQDPLTRLWNRAAILELLRQELARARREGQPVGLVLADLDRLQTVNRSHGRAAGDELLQKVATRIAFCVRAYDPIGRPGADEFLVLLPGCDEHGARQVAERVRQTVSDEPIPIADAVLDATLSLGVTACPAAQAADADTLVEAVLQAAREAQRAGGNQMVVVRAPSPP